MAPVQRVTLIGLGAIGASYGERLLAAPDVELRVLVDEERKRRYEASGIRVNGRPVPFPLHVPADRAEPADLVLFCVKYDDLARAIEMVRGHVGPRTAFMSLLNGIASEDDIQAAFPHHAVLHAISVAIDAVRVGRDISYSTLGYISFGDATGRHQDAVRAVGQIFDRAGIRYEIPEDILRTVWWKFMINVGVNQASAILRAPYGVFQQSADAREVMRLAMREVVAIAQKRGIALTEDDVVGFDQILCAMSPEGKTSMLQDVEAGRPTEVEQFAGKVIQLGADLGVPTPVNQLLYHAIHALAPREAVSSAFSNV
ncbi:ketopantoate reductase family protein [Alicyclobacillus vulcanalis]|uniref:2-dehydropantoate 2-reductase n=1 Tax=Alicyclobacillus vulcanalis TaxID=252246 RepID=A0A1N7LJT3_9BACL|nr:2-dehydropantoate 2-reductase [Alicyclobacillus vulcanalis]SIS74076.1 2-dehydropantoate 2-reductase [Alicyclobacillus vulcanalis]